MKGHQRSLETDDFAQQHGTNKRKEQQKPDSKQNKRNLNEN